MHATADSIVLFCQLTQALCRGPGFFAQILAFLTLPIDRLALLLHSHTAPAE